VTQFGMFGNSIFDIDIDIDDGGGGQNHTTYGRRDARNS
jgi:hypothetical protein